MRTAWLIFGGVMLVLAALDNLRWPLGWMVLFGAGMWAACGLLIFPRRSALEVESAWSNALARNDVRLALMVLAALWVLLTDLLGTYAAMIVLALGGLASLLCARAGAQPLAAILVNGALLGASLTAPLFALEGVLHLPSVAARLGTPAERARWAEQRYDRLWQRNTFGFRSRHETVARGPKTLRILALGDSFTWGDKIASSDSTWPALLEDRLAQERPQRDVEVINMGRNGFTTANEAELLRRIGWEFDPDAVVIQFFRNDALPSGPNYRREASTYLAPRHILIPDAFRHGRIAESALLDLLENRYSRLLNRSPVDPWLRLYEVGFVGWEQLKDALHEMGSSAADRSIPIYLVLFPELLPGAWRPESHAHDQIHQRVIATAEAAGMRIVDLTRVFGDGRTDGRTWWATPYDSHPNVRAHQVAAAALRDALLAEGGLLGVEKP